MILEIHLISMLRSAGIYPCLPFAVIYRMDKKPFDIDDMLRRVESAVAPYPKAAMFQLAEEGYGSLFHQLIGCIISIRTKDETTIPLCRRLFSAAGTPAELAALSPEEIDHIITPSTFHRNKAAQIREIARITTEEYRGELPCDESVLRSFSGVGVKCAHLSLGIACGEPLVSVDIHVHRVTNRWGLVETAAPETTGVLLAGILQENDRVRINALLVPFGKHICTGTLPKCTECVLLEYCRQVGVSRYR